MSKGGGLSAGGGGGSRALRRWEEEVCWEGFALDGLGGMMVTKIQSTMSQHNHPRKSNQIIPKRTQQGLILSKKWITYSQQLSNQPTKQCQGIFRILSEKEGKKKEGEDEGPAEGRR